MAKTSNLREFQESILLKLKEATQQGSVASTSRLGISSGSKNYLINLNEVKEVLPVPPLQPIPLTKPWFLGIANVRGNLYNISDLAQFMGMPPTHRSINNRIVLLSTESTTQVALVIESLIGLRSVEAMQLQKNNDMNLAFSKKSYVDDDNNEWFELDIESIVQNQDFIQPNI